SINGSHGIANAILSPHQRKPPPVAGPRTAITETFVFTPIFSYLLLLQQIPQNLRRNGLPVKFIERALLLSHESLAGSPGELREGAETASRSHGILQHAPAAFAWVEMGPTMGHGQPWLWSPLPRLAVRGRSTRPPPVPGRTQPGSKRPFDLTQPEVLCRLSDL